MQALFTPDSWDVMQSICRIISVLSATRLADDPISQVLQQLKNFDTNAVLTLGQNATIPTKEQIKHVVAIYPTDYVFPTSNEAKSIFNGSILPIKENIESGEISLDALTLVTAKKQQNIQNALGISFARLQDYGIFIDKLHPIDESIHNALLSLFLCGNDLVSIPSIYRTLTDQPKGKMTEEWARTILESINRMRNTEVIYNDSDYAEYYGLEEHKTISRLIDADISRSVYADGDAVGAQPSDDIVLINGRPVGFYVKLYRFPLYDWANDKDQIARYPMQQLCHSVSKSPSNVILSYALLKRIKMIESATARGAASISHTIVYDSVFQDARLLEQPDGTPYTPGTIKKKKSTLKGYARRMLDAWAQNGIIKSYTENYKGKTAYSVTIHPKIPPKANKKKPADN